MTDELRKAASAAHQALDTLSKLGNGSIDGNSEGKTIAIVARNNLRAALEAEPKQSALTRFKECEGNTETDPLERLRFFCSLAMNGQDWLDVEPFFDALKAKPQEPVNYEYQDREGNWKPFINHQHYLDTRADGTWPIRALYTAAPQADRDALRYRLLRRGQKWSVINGIGDVLRAEELDEAVDAAMERAK